MPHAFSTSSQTKVIAGIILAAVILIGGIAWLLWQTPSGSNGVSGKPEAVTFSDEKDPKIGPIRSKVVVHMYSDLQCPACRSAEAGLKPTIQKYLDRVLFVWKDFPLEQIHQNARIAAKAARCANAQGWFWRFHDKLYQEQATWSGQTNPSQTFVDYAKLLGADSNRFTLCLNGAEEPKIQEDIDEGMRNHVDATPTFFVNNKRYFGMSEQSWSQILDAELAATGSNSTTTK